MNKHIELTKRWLADHQSVTVEELEANAEGAANAAQDTDAAGWAAQDAAKAVEAVYAVYAAYWVRRYEELTDE